MGPLVCSIDPAERVGVVSNSRRPRGPLDLLQLVGDGGCVD